MAFVKGKSGNPKGRPAGKTAATLLRKKIADNMPGIVEALVDNALHGDVQAAKILIDRICPPLKPQSQVISLPVNGSLAEQGDEIIKATLGGLIPPDVGSQLITALSAQAKVVETDELTRRIEALEKKHDGND